ncbi:MAG: DUF4166 domain-containing protein [Dongiaceae bacterium]
MTAPFLALTSQMALGQVAADGPPTGAALKVLILGGYGTFGGRLAQLLANEPGVTLLIAGRSRDKAVAFCASLPAGAESLPLAFDRDGDVETQIARIAPDLIVDATGPFQTYGDDPYRVVKACLALGISYLDLADGSAFVQGIGQFDAAARARNIFILAGASSFPVLTAAVVRQLAKGLARVETISAGIAPSPDPSAVGPNVLRAIAEYAGKRTTLVRDGRRVTGYALTGGRRYTIAPPGRLPLESRRFSLVQVPDLDVLPALWPDLLSVWIGAGTVPPILHRALNGLAWMVRLRLLSSLSPFAGLFYCALQRLSCGEHRGGMFVAVEGMTPAGERLGRAWHLLAEGDDGPFIPAMAAAAFVRNCLADRPPSSGARSAATDLELVDYAPLFNRRAIYAGVREWTADGQQQPLYRRLLGAAWTALPVPLQVMHGLEGRLVAEGRATVERGNGLLARLIAALFGFPGAGRDVPARLEFERRGNEEIWRRTFAGRSFASVQSVGSGRFDHLIVERFGPFAFGVAAVLADDRLQLVLRRWSFLGLSLPLRLAPTGKAYECAADDRFHFHVELGHPLTGLIVRYRGWLAAPAVPGSEA